MKEVFDIEMKYVKIKLSSLGMRKIIANKNGDIADEAFLKCLWNYVTFSKSVNRNFISCPFCNEKHSFHKMYNFIDSKKCKLIYSYKDAIVKVGNSIMYIVTEDGKVIYEVPDLFFHFFAEHNMIPKEFFKKAVMYGVKPGNSQYYECIKEEFLNNTETKCIQEKKFCNVCKKETQGGLAYIMNNSHYNKINSYFDYPYNNSKHNVKYKCFCYECGNYINGN